MFPSLTFLRAVSSFTASSISSFVVASSSFKAHILETCAATEPSSCASCSPVADIIRLQPDIRWRMRLTFFLMDFSFRARGGGCCTAAGRKSSEGRDPNAFCVRPLLADPDRNNPDPDRSTPREHRAGDAPGDSFDFLAGLSLASVFSLSSDLAVVFLSVTFSFRFASWDATFGEMRQKGRHKEMPSSIFSLFLSRARTQKSS
jgi:hypothetical protein